MVRIPVPVPVNFLTLSILSVLFCLFLTTLVLNGIPGDLAKKYKFPEPVATRAVVISGIYVLIYLVVSPYFLPLVKYW